MSEYQYYEWQSVDRILTHEEQAAVDKLSSHIQVSSSQAVVTYNWGDFRHDPKEILLKYFDAHFYQANWGSLRLMFRFPKGLVDEAAIEPYCVDEFVSLETSGEYLLLDLNFNSDDGGEWVETDGSLSHFIRLRADILDGDYRLLYLAWLQGMVLYGLPDDEYQPEDNGEPVFDREPPLPAGLKKLTPALHRFVQVFEIDPFLVKAAAEASPDPQPTQAIDYASLVSHLSRAESDDFLARLLQNEPGLALTLRKKLAAYLPPTAQPGATPSRTLRQLLQRAGELEKAEKKRQAEAAQRKHTAEMKTLASKEGQLWKQVEDTLDNGQKSASVYNEATGLLEKLWQLAEFQSTENIFCQHLRRLAEKYASRPSLLSRWHIKGWI